MISNNNLCSFCGYGCATVVLFQYLEFGQLDKTLSVFERECTERGKPIAPTDPKPKTNNAKQLAAQVNLIIIMLFMLNRWNVKLQQEI